MWEILSKAPEPDPHHCDLPDWYHYHFQINDVIQCKECRQKWVLRENEDVFGPRRAWTKLRWYHFKAHQRLSELTKGQKE